MFPSLTFPPLRCALVGAAAFALLSSFAVDTANAYPDQPIKIIVTFPPDVAPLAEQGLSEFESVGWFGCHGVRRRLKRI